MQTDRQTDQQTIPAVRSTTSGNNYTQHCIIVMSQFIIVYPAGLFSTSNVQSMVCEVNKMQDLHHPQVMSLIGVCLDAGPGIAIVMPYMANGSLFDYLKRERGSLELDDDCEIHQVCGMGPLCQKYMLL